MHRLLLKRSLSLAAVFLFLMLPKVSLATSFDVGAGVRLTKKVKTWKDVRNKNVVRQSLDFSCGAAGLSTIFNYYLNDPINETAIINGILQTVDIAKVKARRGFSLLDLKRFAEDNGYLVTGYQMDAEFLKELGKPALCPIKFKNYRHFVIVRGIIGDRVFITDPAIGNLTMKVARFENIWVDGIGLVIEHSANEDHSDSRLVVNKEDAIFADYKNIMRTVNSSVLRTAVFPDEF